MKKKVGLALGAGGAKGLAHIGVLQVLEREKIPLDLITGSSMGAVVGAAFAAGSDLAVLEKVAAHLNQSLFVDVTVPRKGLLKGEKVMQLLMLLTHNKTFSQLNIPLAVVATDVERGERVVFTEGHVATALRASISIPGIFIPVRLNGRLLVDGAVKEKVPISTAKEMGAEITIGVDVKYWMFDVGEKTNITNIYEVIMHSIDILENSACQPALREADVLITPDVSFTGVLEFQKAEECIAAGRKAAEEKISEIKTVLGLN